MPRSTSSTWGGMALATLIILAAIFSFWHLSRPDIITDESSYATRAIGLVDFDFGIEQPTPWQWVDEIPRWMRLSFHDHPPLVFWLQHYSIRLFGETPLAIRLPSVIAGLGAVWLVYLIGKRLYSPAVGLASASIFAFTASHVWISRLGLQESILVALMLASFFFFLRGLENPKQLPWAGIFLGLAFLAKYLALILVPIAATLLVVRHRARKSHYNYDRSYIRIVSKEVISTAVVFLLVASPVIIYNIQLYRTFGHFDFQFSLLLGQDVAAWQERPGQEVLGPYAERLRTYLPRLIETNSPYFLTLAAAGIALTLWEIARRRSNRSLVIGHWTLVIVLAWLLAFLVFIGPAHRFLTLLAPWLAIAAGYLLASIAEYVANLVDQRSSRRHGVRYATAGCVAVVVALEAFYAYNSVIALDPIGPRPWAHSYLHRQAGSWGFNELGAYLERELAGKMPDPAITFEFPFAQDLLQKAVVRGQAEGLAPVPWGIVYNDNINLSSQLWVFLRRIVYEGWPVMSAENFHRGGGEAFLRESGVGRVLFVNATPAALQDRTRPPTPDGDIVEAELKAEGLRPKEIRDPRGEVAFRLYEFELQ